MLDTSSSIRQRFQFEQDSAIEFLLQVLHINDRAFVEGCLWDINSFDQWGVELGKELATSLLPAVQGRPEAEASPATDGLLSQLRQMREMK